MLAARKIMDKAYATGASGKDQEIMIDEAACIERARHDHTYFKPLYEKYYESIFRFVYNRVEDKETAFDLTADVFLKGMLSLQQYEHQGLPFSSWLYRIARNVLADVFRKQSKMRVVSISSVQLYNVMDEIEADHREPYLHRLAQLIAGLREEDLQLVEMRFFEKRSFKELAEILDSTEAAVKMKLYRLLQEIKEQLIKGH